MNEDFELQFLNDFLAPINCLKINKSLIKRFGLKLAIYIAVLKDYYNTQKKDRTLVKENGYFFFPMEDQSAAMGLSKAQVRWLKRKLLGLEIIQVKTKGIPPRQWYKIDFSKIPEVSE